LLNSLLNIVFPNLCVVCNHNLHTQELHICLNCQINLPKTNYHLYKDNPVEKAFWGRFPLQKAFSFLYFNNKGAAQKLLHELKYKQNKELAYFLGVLYAQQLKEIIIEHDISAIVAIPLHHTKLKLRGYNQSEWFVNGLANEMPIANYNSLLTRIKATETQTKKTRFERWQNVEQIFSIKNKDLLEGRHILLVDDVITTGATIESCALELLKIKDVKLSVASIAYVN
jgi:ComF family protein